jgi:hypothetical protein
MAFTLASNTYLPPVIQIPSTLEITAISKSNPMVVTTSMNSDQVNTYIPGQAVKFNIPVTYGMWQLNNMTAVITSVSSNLLTFNINSTNFDTFSIPPSGSLQPASLAPSGSRNLQYSNSTSQVPFQSLNNIGN